MSIIGSGVTLNAHGVLPPLFVYTKTGNNIVSAACHGNNLSLFGFAGQSYLTSVDLTDATVRTIEEYAFYQCTNLSNITLPNTIRNIKYRAFGQCTNLQLTTLPSSLITLGEQSFASSGISITELPASISSLSNQVFLNCTNISGRFDCSKTTISYFPYGCFSGTNITELIMPATWTTSSYSIIGNTLLSVTSYAVNPPRITVSTYKTLGNSLTSVYVPSQSVDAYKAADGWKTYASIISAIPT